MDQLHMSTTFQAPARIFKLFDTVGVVLRGVACDNTAFVSADLRCCSNDWRFGTEGRGRVGTTGVGQQMWHGQSEQDI